MVVTENSTTDQSNKSIAQVATGFYLFVFLSALVAFGFVTEEFSGHWQLLEHFTIAGRSPSHSVVLRNGKIHRFVNHDLQSSEALQYWRKAVAKQSQFDLTNGYLMPGLADAWVDLEALGTQLHSQNQLQLRSATDYEDMLNRVESHLITHIDPWLIGYGYSPDSWKSANRRAMHRQDLDIFTGDKPTILIHGSGKQGLANTAALVACGISLESSKLPKDELERDQYQAASGIVSGNTLQLIYKRAYQSGAPTRRDKFIAAINHLRAIGRTDVFVRNAKESDYLWLVELQKSHRIPVNLFLFVNSQNTNWIEKLLKSGSTRTGRIQVIGVEISQRKPIVRGFEGFPSKAKIRYQPETLDTIHRALKSQLKVFVNCTNVIEFQYVMGILSKHSANAQKNVILALDRIPSRQLVSLAKHRKLILVTRELQTFAGQSDSVNLIHDEKYLATQNGIAPRSVINSGRFDEYVVNCSSLPALLFGWKQKRGLSQGAVANFAVLPEKPVKLNHSWQMPPKPFRTYVLGKETQPIQ